MPPISDIALPLLAIALVITNAYYGVKDGMMWKYRIQIAIGILIMGFSIWSGISNREDKEDADKLAIKRERNRNEREDSLVRESNKVLVKSFGDAIGVYKLGWDSANKRITDLEKLLRDSANRKTTYVQGESPNISFCENGLQFDRFNLDTIHYSIGICSQSAPSILKESRAYIISSEYELGAALKNMEYVGSNVIFKRNIGLGKDLGKRQDLFINGPTVDKIKTIIVLVKGSYTDSYGKNLKDFEEIGWLKIPTKKFGTIASPYDDEIKDFLKSKGIKL